MWCVLSTHCLSVCLLLLLLQRAMTGSRSPDGSGPPPDLINRMLAANFSAMVELGDDVLKPFLQVHACSMA